MRTFLKKLILLLTISTIFPLPVFAENFSDVKEGDRYYLPIMSLQEEGLINGYPDGSFKSYKSVNRAEALKMLTIACKLATEETLDQQSAIEDPFTDTPLSEWYTPYLLLAKKKGIIEGYEDRSFKPGQDVNLAENLKMYFECFDNIIYPEMEKYLFNDTPSDSWFTKYTTFAASRELLNINPDNNIYPEQKMSRGYLTEIIYKLNKFAKGYHFGKATYYGESFHGRGTASGQTLDIYAYTAAHKTLSFGTIVEVTNIANGKSITVEITDRGPYVSGRSIDLTPIAFEAIAPLSNGIINVQYKVKSGEVAD